MLNTHATLHSVGRRLWWSTAPLIGVAGIGASYVDLGTAEASVLATLVGFLTAFTGWAMRTQVPDPPPVPPLVPLGVMSAGTVLAAVGLLVALGPAGLAICVAVGLTGWRVLRSSEDAPDADGDACRIRRPQVQPGPHPEPRRQVDTPGGAPLPSLTTLPTLCTAELCRIWRLTYPRLERAGTAADTERLSELRQSCLAELQRRDPVAFERWLPTARAASDPARVFCPPAARKAPP